LTEKEFLNIINYTNYDFKNDKENYTVPKGALIKRVQIIDRILWSLVKIFARCVNNLMHFTSLSVVVRLVKGLGCKNVKDEPERL
jgi:hypothetical protein